MGVLQYSTETVTYSHDLPVAAPLTELENVNALHYTGYAQHSDTDQRRAVTVFRSTSSPLLQKQRPGTRNEPHRKPPFKTHHKHNSLSPTQQ